MADTVYILLGSNLGDREQYLAEARKQIETLEGLEITAVSGMYVTEAREMKGDNPSFLNQVIQADYIYTPMELLVSLEEVERCLARTDKGHKLARTIDCDILLFGTHIIDTPRLTVPHPRLLERAFAMIPLLEIDPNLHHPVTRKAIDEAVRERDRATVILYRDHVAREV